MLRYNNGGIAAKPVDYYRPLTVDVSVEYELPKEVAPPKGSAPLLIIHPSAYFRAKGTGGNQSTTATPHVKSSSGGQSQRSTPTSRLGDIASTLYYLSTSGLPNPNAPHLPSSPMNQQHPHINNSKSHRYGHQTEHPPTTSRITRSRTAAKAERNHQQSSNCDDYRNRSGHVQPISSVYAESGNQSGGVIKKTGNPAQVLHHHHQQQQQQVDGPIMNQSGYGGGPIPMDSTLNNSTSIFSNHHQQHPPSSYASSNKLSSAPRNGASNKRLRMMSQQQQQQSTATNPIQLLQYSGNGMEPLNLALTPTAPAYNNQFSSFLGYGLQAERVVGVSPVTMATYPYHHHMSGGVLQNGHHFIAAGQAQQQQQQVMSSRGLVGGVKEGPVPVDKGSGSDSGVCSENDSDVSPPMAAPFSSSSTTSHSSSRRSNLSTEFQNSGCYCCCCPSTTSTSARKNSKAKGHQAPPPANTSSAFPTTAPGLTNYGNFFNVIHQQLLGDGGGVVEPLGGSPMDSSGPSPVHYHHQQQQQQRKWTTGHIPDLGIVNGPGSGFGRWYQV